MTGCEALAGAALAWCLSRQPNCLPPGTTEAQVSRLAALADIESGPRGPWAIRDETEKRSLWFRTRAEAEREALARHARGAVLGLGPWQITHERNHRLFGLADASGRPVRAFDLCLNARAALRHTAADEARVLRLAQWRQYNGGPRALVAGSVPAADAYALRVEARLGGAAAPMPAARPETVWDVWADPAASESPAGEDAAPPAGDPQPRVIVENR